MRKFLAVAVAALLFSGGFVATALRSPSAVAGQAEPKTVTVYVTKTGKKYHRDGCQYLRRSKIAMNLEEARKVYTPCLVCKPPE